MLYRSLFALFAVLIPVASPLSAQSTNPAGKKFNIYKIDVNPGAVKEGIRGISVVFQLRV